jgi:hypothetical protein
MREQIDTATKNRMNTGLKTGANTGIKEHNSNGTLNYGIRKQELMYSNKFTSSFVHTYHLVGLS